ncbi:hypothetical protein D3C81_900840 [compost metagenome]
MNIPNSRTVMMIKVRKALLAFSMGSLLIPAGTFLLKLNNAAAKRNNKPTPTYRYTTLFKGRLAISESEIGSNVPNSEKPITNGPIVVPNELIPPPRLTRDAPVFGSPNKTAKGLAAVCCNENPSATTNRPNNIPIYKFTSTATIIAAAPNAENSRP